MSRKITKKFMYIVIVMALLAMMIPAAVPVAAAEPVLEMTLINPLTQELEPEETTTTGYNVTGSIVNVVSDTTPLSWTILDIATGPSNQGAVFIGDPNANTEVQVQGVWGESAIQANFSGNVTVDVNKKWGQILYTDIDEPSSSYVTWNEGSKSWSGSASITDLVYGDFLTKEGTHFTHELQGVILNWYIVEANSVVNMGPAESDVLNADAAFLDPADFVAFAGGGTYTQTVTDANGASTVDIEAWGQESVKIVVVPEYPGGYQIPVVTEVTAWSFNVTEMEVVPQVRWAGEKIVLEKYFGDAYNGSWVKFALQNQSVGSLEGIDGLVNITNSEAVWTEVWDGYAGVILTSSDEGVSQVTAGLYEDYIGGWLINQHYFTTYWLKFESLTLGDVKGKREFHNDGRWETLVSAHPTNPWDPTGSYNETMTSEDMAALMDEPTQTLNVSQDALLRARVKGWFTSSNPSTRGEAELDMDQDGETDLVLPEGRWVLPDDWAKLAGPNWQKSRMHWDIMCNPYGDITAPTPLGDYDFDSKWEPVVGPFSPGIELMTPEGWDSTNMVTDGASRLIDYEGEMVEVETVVPDGNLNYWDAPMPPAKIIFQILDPSASDPTDNAGFFKATDKADVYYINGAAGIEYTNPFYCQFVPAHFFIPPFINNGGYEWDSFGFYGQEYGPYPFWTFINQYASVVPTSDVTNHPTAVEVYSDNHGEAMVWLNGDWNLDLYDYFYKASAVNIPFGSVVATTTVQATADYPYSRAHQAIQSELDVKTWLWGAEYATQPGEMVLGTDTFYNDLTPGYTDTRMVIVGGEPEEGSVGGSYPYETGRSLNKMAWVWVTDRDGQYWGVEGDMVTWIVTSNAGSVRIATGVSGLGLSDYNEITAGIELEGGFLADTNGMVTNAEATQGISYLRQPTDIERDLFDKFWGAGYTDPGTGTYYPPSSDVNGLNPYNYCVAAIDLYDVGGNYTSDATVQVEILSSEFSLYLGEEHTSKPFFTNVDFSIVDALDDGIIAGDANCDGVVNMGDVTAVERMILGYQAVTSNAVINSDYSVDMGTVVKIERKILGLK